MRSPRGGITSFLVTKYVKVARVMALEVLQTLRIWRFSSKCCGGEDFLEIPGSKVIIQYLGLNKGFYTQHGALYRA
jgi:hypothetical protein